LDVDGSGVIGRIEIESLGIMLPIYLGTSETVLARGVGHIQGTSAPVGGESTHAILTGHTGLPSVKLFTGVDRLANGDTFTLYILNEILTYEVDQKMTVLPHEVEALAIEKGSDYVTLVTCTPYGINSHRLLIRGERIETPPEKYNRGTVDGGVENENNEPNWFQQTMDQVVAFFAAIVESVATFLVRATEWGMDLFGVEY
jgi:sortase A